MPDIHEYKTPKTRSEKKGRGKDHKPYSTKHVRLVAALLEKNKK